MRPLELRLRNFRSYFGQEAVFSFRGRSLVGIVGPIGAGKSSILDAIAFALYGKTPTVAAATKGLIHQRAGDAAVALRFEVDGQVWEAQRLLRRKGQSQHALYRYETDVVDEEPVERITMEADVNARVVELLGLEFDAFGRSVLLAQNRFAEFLRARPVERDKVLKGVFGHDRLDAMREVAKAKVAGLGVELDKIGLRVDQLERATTRLAERRVALDRVEERVEALRKAEPAMAELTETIEQSLQRAASAQERLAEIRSLATVLPEPAVTDQMFDDVDGAADRRGTLATALESAQAELTDAERALADAEAAGIAETIDQAAALLAALAPLDRAATTARRRLEELGARLQKASAASDSAAIRVQHAEEAGAAAEAALHARTRELADAEAAVQVIRHSEMAMTLRADLHEGDSCPVCAQEVAEVPGLEPSPNLAAAIETHEAARLARDRAETTRVKTTAEVQAGRESLTGLRNEVTRLETEHANAVKAAEDAEKERSASAMRLQQLLGEGDFEEKLRTKKEDLAARHDAVARARKGAERVRSEHDAAIREEQEIRKRLSALHLDLVRVVSKLGVSIAIDDETPAVLSEAVEQLRQTWTGLSKELAESAALAAETEAKARKERNEIVESLGIEGEFGAALAAATTEAKLTGEAVAEYEAEIAASAGLIEQRDELRAQQSRFEQVASDLTDSKFVRYLLDDERTRLAALGSQHFERLSSGRYRFSEDGKFEIVDLTAAEAVRRADSLSGGETFLASLALALALAEMVARTGGRLDAFFIDEGFGSLDPEHLDLAMEGIEALVAETSDRLVVVVSHVPELRHRIEDLIELDRSPTTGDTRVVRA